MEMNNWHIFMFKTERGEKPVIEFIGKQSSATRSKITQLLDLLSKYGVFLNMPHAKKLTKEIYELRIRGKQEIRILYGFLGNEICLLHAFKKQTQMAPPKEIKTAFSRFQLLTR